MCFQLWPESIPIMQLLPVHSWSQGVASCSLAWQLESKSGFLRAGLPPDSTLDHDEGEEKDQGEQDE